MSDADDEYTESLDRDLREIRGALFDDTLAVLSPPEPVCVRESAMVQEAVDACAADGPVIVLGHSFGGYAITQLDPATVAHLVYLAAIFPTDRDMESLGNPIVPDFWEKMDVADGKLTCRMSGPDVDWVLAALVVFSRVLPFALAATWASLNTDELLPLQNRALQGRYSPGSTFKIVTASAGLEERLVTPSQVLDCGNGEITIANITIREHDGKAMACLAQRGVGGDGARLVPHQLLRERTRLAARGLGLLEATHGGEQVGVPLVGGRVAGIQGQRAPELELAHPCRAVEELQRRGAELDLHLRRPRGQARIQAPRSWWPARRRPRRRGSRPRGSRPSPSASRRWAPRPRAPPPRRRRC